MAVAARRRVDDSKYRIIDALNADWRLLQGADAETVQRWSRDHAVMTSCRNLDDVLSAVRLDPDPTLAALLEEDARGDALAGRVVLQAMLGKVVRMAGSDPRACVDDYVAAMWCRIRTYPLVDRPVKIAANLALDVLKAVGAETRWSRRGAVVAPIPPGVLLDQLHADALVRARTDHNGRIAGSTADSVITTAGELGLIDGPTRAVLLSVYAEGLSGRDAADRHQTTAAMVRFRCSRGVRRLAQHSASLAEAA